VNAEGIFDFLSSLEGDDGFEVPLKVLVKQAKQSQRCFKELRNRAGLLEMKRALNNIHGIVTLLESHINRAEQWVKE